LPYWSRAVTANEMAEPAVAAAGAATARCVAGPALTATDPEVPVMEEDTVSVAVTV